VLPHACQTEPVLRVSQHVGSYAESDAIVGDDEMDPLVIFMDADVDDLAAGVLSDIP
jgi:hypothetical protein